MTAAKIPENDETARLHRLVVQGTLEEVRAALEQGAEVNSLGHCGETALMRAIAARDIEKLKLLLKHGADPEQTDDFNHTALHSAVAWDYAEGVRYLLSLGVDRGYQPKYPLKNVEFEIPLDVPMPEQLEGVLSEEQWRESLEMSREFQREMNPTVAPMIRDVQSVEVLKLFVEAGDPLDLAPNEVKRALVGLREDEVFRASREDYQTYKTPHYGARNPERMDNPFWSDMIRTGGNAYSARTQFNDTEDVLSSDPVWCYDRHGSSLTPLADGRFVQIAGEHEDFYDPDFYIYNDVVVHDGQGNFQIYGYPPKVFPPTDFHTATLVNDSIYIIGCLGYLAQRQEGFTPVYRLQLESWEIEAVETTGEMPGWVYEHQSRYEPDRNVIHIAGGMLHVMKDAEAMDLVANEGEFELDLSSMRWRNVK